MISEVVLSWLLTIAKNLAMGAAFWLLWTLRNAFIAGWNIQKFINKFEESKKSLEGEIVDLKAEIVELKESMVKAGKQTSDLASFIQGMPERLRKDFVPRPEIDLMFTESKIDRQRIWDELSTIWKVINRREDEIKRIRR